MFFRQTLRFAGFAISVEDGRGCWAFLIGILVDFSKFRSSERLSHYKNSTSRVSWFCGFTLFIWSTDDFCNFSSSELTKHYKNSRPRGVVFEPFLPNTDPFLANGAFSTFAMVFAVENRVFTMRNSYWRLGNNALYEKRHFLSSVRRYAARLTKLI